DHPIRAIQNLLHLRNYIADAFPSVMAEDEIVNHSSINRSWSIQCVKRREVFNTLRSQLPANLLHPRRFELEDSIRLALAKQLHSLLVVKQNLCPYNFHVKHALYAL